MKPAYAEGCRAEARLRDGGRAHRVVDPAKMIKSYVATAKGKRISNPPLHLATEMKMPLL